MELKRIVVLIGMMGAGKSSLGRRLAARLGVPFFDSDIEIAAAAGCTIPQIFERYGEAAFRDCERKVLDRLLSEPPHVLATGGGAFMDANTRARIKAGAISIWIDTPLDVLLSRVQRKDDRPLLKGGDPREILQRLLTQRGPTYAEADLRVVGDDAPHAETIDRMVGLLIQHGVCEA